MKIAILNGSPRKENTAAMIEAFREGAEEAGHEVEVLHVGIQDMGVCTATGDENKSEAKLAEIKAFAKTL